ncbi:MAG: hypothetical protein WD737_04860 [Gemmatimonadota bacterium]
MQSTSRAALLVALMSLAAACSDSTDFVIEPDLVTDTVEVAAPLPQNAALPTALDVTGDGAGGVAGGRFPEFQDDAGRWDFLVRVQGGQLVLVPAGHAGINNSRAALTPPIEGETFASLREIPGQSTFVSDSAIAMHEGSVYAARSRETSTAFTVGCTQFAKFEPLEVDVAAGRLRIQIVTNQFCGDIRLVPLE